MQVVWYAAIFSPRVLIFHYITSAFGFLPGKEVKEAGVGNLGLQDRRFYGYFELTPDL